MFEKLYLIHNPLDGSKDWVSEREFAIGSQKLKNVFGVLYLDDVKFMLHFNMPFKEALIKENNITDERNLSINHVCQWITSTELMVLINKETNIHSRHDTYLNLEYPSRVELKDGCFFWNSEKECYEELVVKK